MKNQIENPARTSTMIEQITWEDAKAELREMIQEIISVKPNGKKDEDRFLTRVELARKLKITLPTLHKHINTGKFPAYKINGRVLFRYDEVMEALSKSRVTPSLLLRQK